MQENVEFWEICKKYALVVFSALSGVGAKIATLNSQKKVTMPQIWTTALTGLFSCLIAGALCKHYNVEYYLSVSIIGVSAMNGQNICEWILVNSKTIFSKLFQLFIKKQK